MNVFKDAGIVGIGWTDSRSPRELLAMQVLQVCVLLILWMFGLLDSAQVLAVLPVHLVPVLLLALPAAVGDHMASFALWEGFLVFQLLPVEQTTICTKGHS